MSLDRFCRRPLVTCHPEDPVQLAAERMRDAHAGSVLVVDEGGRPVGVVTDRDIVCRAVAPRLDPTRTPLMKVMSGDVGVIRKSDSIDEASFRMRQLGVRRLPIVDEAGRAIGLVALDDLLVLLTAELGQTAAAIRSNRGP